MKSSSEIIKVTKENLSTTNNGIFQGWGTSLCWWANRIGYSPELTEKAAELFYGESGLRLNIMRYNIGGGDDPSHNHIKRTDSMIPGWIKYDRINHKYVYDYTADTNQLNVLRACYEKCVKCAYVEVFSNSPPYFMCKSGCSSGGENPNENNLRDDCYGQFAEYLGNVTEYINNALKIKVNSISPMNEPDTDFWHLNSEKQEGCHFDAGESQNKIIIETAKAIQKRGLDHIEIVASDETSTDKAYNSYMKYSDEAKALMDRVSTHTYGTEQICKLGKLMKKVEMNLWMSETDWGDTAGENAGEMGAGLWIANKIISDINGLSPSAWVLWQTIDYHKSKDGYMGNRDFGIPNTDNGYWGISFADHDSKEIILTQKFYCFGQFSRYIRPGDTLIHINSNTLGAIRPTDKTLTLVSVNDTSLPMNVTFDVCDFKEKGVFKTIRTSGSISSGESWAESEEARFDSPIINLQLKENSVTTFIIK